MIIMQLTSKFFLSREQVAIMDVMQFPPRLQQKQQINISTRFDLKIPWDLIEELMVRQIHDGEKTEKTIL